MITFFMLTLITCLPRAGPRVTYLSAGGPAYQVWRGRLQATTPLLLSHRPQLRSAALSTEGRPLAPTTLTQRRTGTAALAPGLG